MAHRPNPAQHGPYKLGSGQKLLYFKRAGPGRVKMSPSWAGSGGVGPDLEVLANWPIVAVMSLQSVTEHWKCMVVYAVRQRNIGQSNVVVIVNA